MCLQRQCGSRSWLGTCDGARHSHSEGRSDSKETCHRANTASHHVKKSTGKWPLEREVQWVQQPSCAKLCQAVLQAKPCLLKLLELCDLAGQVAMCCTAS